MTIKKSGTVVAVGLAFGLGGHEILLDGNTAEAATPMADLIEGIGLPQSQATGSCAEPSSGCLTFLPILQGGLPSPPFGQTGQSQCFSSENADGSSGFVCLSLGL